MDFKDTDASTLHFKSRRWPFLEDVVKWRAVGGSVSDNWVDRMSHKWTVTILVIFTAVVLWPLLDDVVKWKAIGGSVSDDWVDRMSHKWNVTILVIFSAVVLSAQYVGDPIHCWIPAQYKESFHRDYVKHYCWISNTYHVPMSDIIPSADDVKAETEVSYYQWVPVILLGQALLFKLPNVFWQMTSSSSGINLNKLCRLVDSVQMDSTKERAKSIHNIAAYLDRWIRVHRQYHSNLMVKIKRKISFLLFCFGQREGIYLSGLYLLTKLTYLGNCALQFWLLGRFLSINFIQYGVDSFQCILGDCFRFVESPRFPRVTLCDFQIRQLQNVQPFTVQCVLPINLFNEKIFIFLWFWILLTGTLTLFSTVSWFASLTGSRFHETFAYKFINESVDTASNRNLLKKFSDKYLRTDGYFLLNVVRNNTSDVTMMDLVTDLWKTYKDYNQHHFEDACCHNNEKTMTDFEDASRHKNE